MILGKIGTISGPVKFPEKQGFGSGSGLDPYSIVPVNPDPDPGGQK
jgi:hypothetical protein